MSIYSYRTLEEPSEGFYKAKGSKFLAFAYPVHTESEIRERIDGMKKKYFDARHHCYAWMLGVDRKHFRAFDDGEPNHSAGDPILGQIRSKDLTNVLIVVVRYFGGVKLGVSGLITAYKTAAEDVLSNALIIEREIVEAIDLTFDYLVTPEVMRWIKEFDIKILEQHFSEACTMKISVPLLQKEEFLGKLNFLKATGKSITWDSIKPDHLKI